MRQATWTSLLYVPTEGVADAKMTSFIHTIRMNRIRSRIQYTVYRNASPANILSRLQDIRDIISSLDTWRSHYPPMDGTTLPACSIDFFENEYHNCIQILLRPLVTIQGCPNDLTARCAASAASLLDVECRLLRKDPRNLATWVLWKIFAR